MGFKTFYIFMKRFTYFIIPSFRCGVALAFTLPEKIYKNSVPFLPNTTILRVGEKLAFVGGLAFF
jgi:hypothetical protein